MWESVRMVIPLKDEHNLLQSKLVQICLTRLEILSSLSSTSSLDHSGSGAIAGLYSHHLYHIMPSDLISL